MDKTRTPGIYKDRNKSGRIVYRAVLPARDPATGEHKQKWVTFDTEREAINAKAAQRTRQARGDMYMPAKTTINELLDNWLEAKAPPAVKQSSYDCYKGTVETYIRPYLGATRVTALDERAINAHYRRLRAKGVKPHAVRAVHKRLSDLLRSARAEHLIDRNPIENVDVPPIARREYIALDDDEIDRFLQAARSAKFGPIWSVAILTGMRRGELLGLRWCDVDEKRGLLKVRQQISGVAHRDQTSAPKYGSARDISVPGWLFRDLRAHRAQQAAWRLAAGPDWQESDLVFTHQRGGTIPEGSLCRDIDKVLERAGLPHMRIHDIRHTHGSYLTRHGKSHKEVAERLGHRNASVTLNVYTHTLRSDHTATAHDLDVLDPTGTDIS